MTRLYIVNLIFNFYAEYLMRNAGLEEVQAGIRIAGKNINNLRYADDTTLKAQSEEELKSLLMKVKEESEKVGLKLNIVSRGLLSSCGAWASHCSGFSCGAQALGAQASVTAAHGFNSCSSWPVKHRISSCDAQA